MTTLWNYVSDFTTLTSYCAAVPIQTAVCQGFWIAMIIASLAFAGAVALYLIWRELDYRAKLRAALAAEEERERLPNAVTMNRYLWAGDKVYTSDETEIDRLMAEGIEARKREVRVVKLHVVR